MKIALEMQYPNEYTEKTIEHSDMVSIATIIDIFYE